MTLSEQTPLRARNSYALPDIKHGFFSPLSYLRNRSHSKKLSLSGQHDTSLVEKTTTIQFLLAFGIQHSFKQLLKALKLLQQEQLLTMPNLVALKENLKLLSMDAQHSASQSSKIDFQWIIELIKLIQGLPYDKRQNLFLKKFKVLSQLSVSQLEAINAVLSVLSFAERYDYVELILQLTFHRSVEASATFDRLQHIHIDQLVCLINIWQQLHHCPDDQELFIKSFEQLCDLNLESLSRMLRMLQTNQQEGRLAPLLFEEPVQVAKDIDARIRHKGKVGSANLSIFDKLDDQLKVLSTLPKFDSPGTRRRFSAF